MGAPFLRMGKGFQHQKTRSLADYQADNASHHTHTTDGRGFWNRKLDYLFTNGRWLACSGTTHQDEASGGMATMPLSDHAPVSARLEWPR